MKYYLAIISNSLMYKIAIAFFAAYPIFTSIVWIITTLLYYQRREHVPDPEFYRINEKPFVSIIIPIYFEEKIIAQTIESALEANYPNFEVLVVDDGSRDGTQKIVRLFMHDKHLKFIRKDKNEGKSMAINDALPLTKGSIIVVIDGDARIHPEFLNYVVPHFVKLPRVAAITGNPRVSNTQRLLTKIQAIEFSSIISILKRSQTIWGRILTVSGVVSAYRKSALMDVGLFDPGMATEDISLSWKLQKRFYDIRYEPRAIAEMQVPNTVLGLWRQRVRWAKGLGQVLRANANIWLKWRYRRLWPVFLEANFSIIWAYCFVVLTTFWILSYSIGYKPLGASPIPNWWGMLVATFALTQLLVGVVLDRQYDKSITSYYFWAVLYPLFYWIYMSLVTFISTPIGFLRRPYSPVKWHTERKQV